MESNNDSKTCGSFSRELIVWAILYFVVICSISNLLRSYINLTFDVNNEELSNTWQGGVLGIAIFFLNIASVAIFIKLQSKVKAGAEQNGQTSVFEEHPVFSYWINLLIACIPSLIYCYVLMASVPSSILSQISCQNEAIRTLDRLLTPDSPVVWYYPIAGSLLGSFISCVFIRAYQKLSNDIEDNVWFCSIAVLAALVTFSVYAGNVLAFLCLPIAVAGGLRRIEWFDRPKESEFLLSNGHIVFLGNLLLLVACLYRIHTMEADKTLLVLALAVAAVEGILIIITILPGRSVFRRLLIQLLGILPFPLLNELFSEDYSTDRDATTQLIIILIPSSLVCVMLACLWMVITGKAITPNYLGSPQDWSFFGQLAFNCVFICCFFDCFAAPFVELFFVIDKPRNNKSF